MDETKEVVDGMRPPLPAELKEVLENDCMSMFSGDTVGGVPKGFSPTIGSVALEYIRAGNGTRSDIGNRVSVLTGEIERNGIRANAPDKLIDVKQTGLLMTVLVEAVRLVQKSTVSEG